MSSPTQRSLGLLRKEGFCVQVVERFNPYAKVRVDLFGFIDIVAIREDFMGILGIQTTSTGNISSRIKKILAIPEAKTWLQCGNKIIVHGWSKRGKVSKRKLWQVTTKEILLGDLKPGEPAS